MSQSDITQHIGMAKEVNDFRAATGEEPYWAESAFSGMPTYQIGSYFPNDLISELDKLIRFLPRPADYLFLYFLGFYLLLLALKTDWKLSILGALAFGFSTYLIIIFSAGHNAKAHAIAYMPLVLAGVIWVFKRKYLLGFTITALAMALEMKASHPQMTYYLLFIILILGIVELVEAIKKKQIPQFVTQASTIIIAIVLGVGVNATRIMATKEYADYSTRGKSELTINSDGTKKENTNGLSRDYITQYSYGIPETFNLLVPRYMGGGTIEKLSKSSETYEMMKKTFGPRQAEGFVEQVFTYWGDQPIIEAPAYIGAVIFFLFFMGVFLVKGKLKKWLVAATIFSILLSWGKNFGFLTDIFIDYVPLYNKFRAVSSIQVIAELCVPLLGILAIKEFFSQNTTEVEKQKALKNALYITLGLIVVGVLYAAGFSTFEGLRDGRYVQMENQYEINGLLDAIVTDRKSLLYQDSLRSLILVGLSFGILFFFLRKKLNRTKAIAAFAVLVLFDQVQVNLRYVNSDDFTTVRRVENPFTPNAADQQIMKDKSHYRVANFTTNPFEDGRTSYYHKSIGGYHAAKMGRYNDLIDFQLVKNNVEVFNMLNIKYFILAASEGKQRAQINPDANGNSWFVNKLIEVDSADEEIKALDSLKTKTEAVVDTRQFTRQLDAKTEIDSTSYIKLTKYSLNYLEYESKSTQNELAVFSEIYYKDGWNAYLDGKPVDHFRVNYVLRGMEVPAGEHIIEFKFEPQVIQTGSTVSLISYALLLLIPIGWGFMKNKKRRLSK